MPNFDGPSLSVPSYWAELYFDTQDADGARLREIVAEDQRLKAAGFHEFLEEERPRLRTLTIYEVGVLLVEYQGRPDGPLITRPWPVEPETALCLVEHLRGRTGPSPAPHEADGYGTSLGLRT